jgi:hypothetical protein
MGADRKLQMLEDSLDESLKADMSEIKTDAKFSASKRINPYGELPIDEIELAIKKMKIIYDAEPPAPKTRLGGFFAASKTDYDGDLFTLDDQVYHALCQAQGAIGSCWLIASINAIAQNQYGLAAIAGKMKDLSEPFPAYNQIRIVKTVSESKELKTSEFVLETQSRQLCWLDQKNKLVKLKLSDEQFNEIEQAEKELIELKQLQQKIEKKSNQLDKSDQKKIERILRQLQEEIVMESGQLKLDQAKIQKLLNHFQGSVEKTNKKHLHKIVKLCQKKQPGKIPTLGDHLGLPSNKILVRMKDSDNKLEYLLLDKSSVNSDMRTQSSFYAQILEKAFVSRLGKNWKNLDPKFLKEKDKSNMNYFFQSLFVDMEPCSSTSFFNFEKYDPTENKDIARIHEAQQNRDMVKNIFFPDFIDEVRLALEDKSSVGSSSFYYISAIFNGEKALQKDFLIFLKENKNKIKVKLESGQLSRFIFHDILTIAISAYKERLENTKAGVELAKEQLAEDKLVEAKSIVKISTRILDHLNKLDHAYSSERSNLFQILNLKKECLMSVKEGKPLIIGFSEKKDVTKQHGFISEHAFSLVNAENSSYRDVSKGFYDKFYTASCKEKEIKSLSKDFFEKHGHDKLLVINCNKTIYLLSSNQGSLEQLELPLSKNTVDGLTKVNSKEPSQLSRNDEISMGAKVEIIELSSPKLPEQELDKKEDKGQPLAKDSGSYFTLTLRNPWGADQWLKVGNEGISIHRQPLTKENPQGSRLVKLGKDVYNIPIYNSPLTTITIEKALEIGGVLLSAPVSFNENTAKLESEKAKQLLSAEPSLQKSRSAE